MASLKIHRLRGLRTQAIINMESETKPTTTSGSEVSHSVTIPHQMMPASAQTPSRTKKAIVAFFILCVQLSYYHVAATDLYVTRLPRKRHDSWATVKLSDILLACFLPRLALLFPLRDSDRIGLSTHVFRGHHTHFRIHSPRDCTWPRCAGWPRPG